MSNFYFGDRISRTFENSDLFVLDSLDFSNLFQQGFLKKDPQSWSGGQHWS